MDDRDQNQLDPQGAGDEREGEEAVESAVFSSHPEWPAAPSPSETVVMANTILSQFTEDMFYVAFGQVIPPYFEFRGLSREEIQQRIPSLPVKVVSRIAISPQKFLEMVQVLETNYDRWAERHDGPARQVQQ